MTKRERVARAICRAQDGKVEAPGYFSQHLGKYRWELFLPEADAAIEAMKEHRE